MITITQQPDYEFPKPKYGFGQMVIDSKSVLEGYEGFIVAMQYTSEQWQYQLYYPKLEVLGMWINEDKLTIGIYSI